MQVTLLPTHPCEGWISMWRYWKEVVEASETFNIEYSCPLGLPRDEPPKRKHKINRLFNQYYRYPKQVQQLKNPKLVHILDHSSVRLIKHLPRSCKVVATVHDLIPLTIDQGLSEGQLQRFRRNISHLRYVDKIVSVSEYTKQIVIEELGIEPEKIIVIPNGVRKYEFVDSADDSCKDEAKICSAYATLKAAGAEIIMLSVGTVCPRKNLEILAILDKQTDVKLGILRVGDLVSASLQETLQASLGERFIQLGRVSETELAFSYKHCDVVIIPSKYEGFGLPVLEAMAYGKPVICSNTTSLPEAGGDVALYFDAETGKGFDECIALLNNKEHLRDLSERGLQRARLYTWEAHIEKLFQVYQDVKKL